MTELGGARACGYFGKIPARADFVTARLRQDTLERWDSWVQEAVTASQSVLGEAWRDLFLNAPIWRFILPPGACGARALIGVVAPSMDAIGRCFPLLLVQDAELREGPIDLLEGSTRWFAALETLALEAISGTGGLAVLDRILPPLGTPARAGGLLGHLRSGGLARARRRVTRGSAGIWAPLPLLSAAPAMLSSLWQPGDPLPGVWWMSGAARMHPGLALCAGLAPRDAFPAFLDGQWSQHGWAIAQSGEDDTTEIASLGPAGPSGSTGPRAGSSFEWDRDA